ncbi:ATP-binding protein [Ectothiorhodospira haloalkaliphila]|uniref:ATP-binding protein n=1 Tax=Ectothiorhodospira haloalkaliphila TaxID=421628 RepID=UPI001EE8599E|nr:ATP-binding protein [Ectothiorhodospira haloalkaliphila]MCG5524321.1 ATP-binding protein [Ectothiorhodospira haloalkaliphila]
MPQKRNLPIGIQSFEKIRRGDHYYVDKTPHLLRLVSEGGSFFLSRPRRFGKSLLLDTLKCLFEGRQDLFEGLFIRERWDWQVRHPVIRLSFADGVLTTREALDVHIDELLRAEASRLGVSLTNTSIPGRFRELIQQIHAVHGQRAVVLIDEYDKPILDNITEPERARAVREGLKNLYSVLKDADPHLRFCLLTGVSKFSKVSLFSGLNNLNDITLDEPYADICGYTDEDVDTVFAPELPGLDRAEIRDWYNGYRWGGTDTASVYNPFDLLLLFQKRRFAPYWFESATPTFLVDLLSERGVFTPRLEAMQTEAELLGRFDVDGIATEALLFQTGYLTVHAVEEPMTGYWLYTLGYPNREVESSLNQALLPALGVPEPPRQRLSLFRVLQAHDLDALEVHFKALFASLPHDWYRNNPIARYEGHYASVFYSHFAALGLQISVEDSSHMGKVDMAVEFGGHVYVYEFKVVEQVPEGRALQQIKDKGYADKYRGRGQPIHLIGVEFSREQRQVVAFEVETVPAT